jgi:hypothetical protein
VVPPARNHAQDDPENVDQPVLATQDHVPEPVGAPGVSMSPTGAGKEGPWRRLRGRVAARKGSAQPRDRTLRGRIRVRHLAPHTNT